MAVKNGNAVDYVVSGKPGRAHYETGRSTEGCCGATTIILLPLFWILNGFNIREALQVFFEERRLGSFAYRTICSPLPNGRTIIKKGHRICPCYWVVEQ